MPELHTAPALSPFAVFFLCILKFSLNFLDQLLYGCEIPIIKYLWYKYLIIDNIRVYKLSHIDFFYLLQKWPFLMQLSCY